jgi:hypothetical protein
MRRSATTAPTKEEEACDRGGFDQRKPQDLARNAPAYQAVLERVKQDLNPHLK